MQQRVRQLREKMTKQSTEAFWVESSANIRYLSGFTSGEDAKLLVTLEEIYLFTDGRYREQATRECPGCTLVEFTGELLDRLKDFCIKYKRLAVEAEQISYASYQKLQAQCPCELVPVVGWIEALRQVKDEAERMALRHSAKVSASVFEPLLETLKPGISEREIALNLEILLKKAGVEDLSFSLIAVAGNNAALPHGKPSSYVLQPGDMLTLDWGGTIAGYVSDMTRTVAIATASMQLQDLYAKVLEAQLTGISLIKDGVEAAAVDAKVRQVLKHYALGEYFLHSTGHGFGLDIHETPSLSARSQEVLQAGMTVTVEPGIYIPGFGGIRIEDSVIVTENGCEILTLMEKRLITT